MEMVFDEADLKIWSSCCGKVRENVTGISIPPA